LLIVVIAVDFSIIVVQFAVPGVVIIVLRSRPKVGVVANIVEITIVVVMPTTRPRRKSSY